MKSSYMNYVEDLIRSYMEKILLLAVLTIFIIYTSSNSKRINLMMRNLCS